MKRLNRLDFLGSPTPPVTGWAMAVLSAVTLTYVAAQLWTLDADSRQLASSLRQSNLAIAAATAPTPRDAVVRVQGPMSSKSASLPWSEVLAVFDQHAEARVGLLRFEPDTEQAGQVRVRARARDADTVKAFVRALEADGRLRNVALLEQAADTSSTERSVSFTVLAAWRGDTAARTVLGAR